MTSRPGHVSVLLSGPGGGRVDATLVDPAGVRLGGADAGEVVREIPFGDVIVLRDGDGAVTGRLFAVAVPEVGTYDLRLRRAPAPPPMPPYDVTIVVPTTGGGLRFLAAPSVQPGEILEPAAAADTSRASRVTGIAAARAAPAPGAARRRPGADRRRRAPDGVGRHRRLHPARVPTGSTRRAASSPCCSARK